MKTTLGKYRVSQICEGFEYNQLEGKGLFGLSGTLTIQPEYQRNYIYAESKRDVGVIDEPVKRSTYEKQTTKAKAALKSNCSYCAIGHEGNKEKIWVLQDMDADHVTAWSKGGATLASNCELLCKTHNRAKGNK